MGWITGEAGLPYVYPDLKLGPGARLAFMPDRTKMGAKDGAMQVEITKDKCCAILWLRRNLTAYEAAGQPITDWITRPMARDKQKFQEAGLSSAEIASVVKQRMKAAGVCAGHTVHGSRRGSMHHDAHVVGSSIQVRRHSMACTSACQQASTCHTLSIKRTCA